MSREATAEAPANIAFIKYWGAADLDRAVPLNRSISMTLSRCVSRTTVRLLDSEASDEVMVVAAGVPAPATGDFRTRVVAHLDRLRRWAGVDSGVFVATENTFPAAAGMASSASGFAALTVALVDALGMEPSTAELSRLAQSSGSGSAARSVIGGYVEWPNAAGHAVQLAAAEHWDLRDVVAMVQHGPKAVSSLQGHVRAPTSPHYARRQELLPERLQQVREAIQARALGALGPVLEADATELHLIAMSSQPPIFYWAPATLRVLERVRALRAEGHEAYSTMDAGANVHVVCDAAAEPAVVAALEQLEGVHGVVRDAVGTGPRRLQQPVLEAEP